jgi:biotin carboxyl carrier protein
MAIHEIKARLPGIFYSRPDPDSPPYKQLGDSVKTGDTVGLIEVMKSFHDVSSDAAGTIKEICVADEEAIMPGQVLMRLET